MNIEKSCITSEDFDALTSEPRRTALAAKPKE